LARIFVQVLLLCKAAGLVTLGHVSLDGSKVKANASKHKAMSYDRMCEAEKRLEEEVKGLLETANQTDSAEDAEYGPGAYWIGPLCALRNGPTPWWAFTLKVASAAP
jgi:hypothetical protein